MPSQTDTNSAIQAALGPRPVTVAALFAALGALVTAIYQPLGGDLSGTMPSPTVVRINGQVPGPFATATTVPASAVTNAGAPAVALTTAGYTVPASTPLVRFTQGAAVDGATIALPAPGTDAASIELDNNGASLTTLSFSPAVAGWTNGAAFVAGSPAVRVRADGTTWRRIQ